jgi:predicted DNA-binding transcriptional regulator AlpA
MSDHRPPAYPSKASLAHELDCAESTIDTLVERGILPKPVRLTAGCVRWVWEDVVLALASLREGTGGDPYMTGVAKLGDEGNGKKKGKGGD